MMSKEPSLTLDGLIILELEPNVKNFFEPHFFFFFQDEWIRLVTYPILDAIIILYLNQFVKRNFYLVVNMESIVMHA